MGGSENSLFAHMERNHHADATAILYKSIVRAVSALELTPRDSVAHLLMKSSGIWQEDDMGFTGVNFLIHANCKSYTTWHSM